MALLLVPVVLSSWLKYLLIVADRLKSQLMTVKTTLHGHCWIQKYEQTAKLRLRVVAGSIKRELEIDSHK